MNTIKKRCIISKAAELYPDDTYLISDEVSLTYLETDFIIDQIILKLKELNINKNTKIGIYSYNNLNYILLLHSLFRIGAAAVLLNIRNPINYVYEQLKRFKLLTLFVDNNNILSCEYNFLDINKIINIKKIKTEISNNSLKKPSINMIDYNSDATIIYSSGTSAESKAVVHSYNNHVKSAEGSNKNIKIEKEDKWALTLPLYHVGGLSIIFRTALKGGTAYINKNLYLDLETIVIEKITHISMVPTQLFRLFKKNPDKKYFIKLKALLLGGSYVPYELLNEALKLNIPVFISYGSSEMASQITCTAPGDNINHLNTSGKILSFRKLKINNTGEILVGGETLCKRIYYNKRIKYFKKKEWYKTGDIGFINEDGYLSINGRIDTMIKSGGENIYPEEIEKSLLKIKTIENAVVVGVKNEEYGEIPAAFIKTIKNNYNINDIINKLSNYLPKFKIPRYFFDWPDNYKEKSIKNNRSFFKKLAISKLNN